MIRILENNAMKLKKLLYGLKTSSKAWFDRLSAEIEKTNYLVCEAEQCLFLLEFSRLYIG